MTQSAISFYFNEYEDNIAAANFCVNEKYKAFYALHSNLIKNILFYFNNTITYVLYVAHFANLYEYLVTEKSHWNIVCLVIRHKNFCLTLTDLSSVTSLIRNFKAFSSLSCRKYA